MVTLKLTQIILYSTNIKMKKKAILIIYVDYIVMTSNGIYELDPLKRFFKQVGSR